MQSDNDKFRIEFKKRLYKFVLSLISFIDELDSKDPATKVIMNQLLRSGTSILANYIEARAASSKKDFINFFSHALKSANESKMWLCLIKDAKKCDPKKSGALLDELIQIANILASSILTLKGKK